MFIKQINNNYIKVHNIKRETLVYFSLTLTTLILSYLFLNKLAEEVNYFILLILVIIFGLPHGALDTLVAKNNHIYKDKTGLVIFNIVYIAIALLTFVFWNYFSILSLFLFLSFSAYHFSEDWKYDVSVFERLILGFSIINLPLYFHQEEVHQIYSYITNNLILKKYIHLQLYLSYLNLFLLLLVLLRSMKNINILFQIGTILISSYFFKPLYFFMCYFCFFHSFKNYKESISFLNNETKIRVNFVVFINILLTLMIGALYYYFFMESFTPKDISKLIFIGLAALTVPHMMLKFITHNKNI